MKKFILPFTIALLAGCTHEPPPMEALAPPDPTVADTVVVQEEVYEPAVVEPAQTPDSPAPAESVPPLENDGAADNSDPAVYVSPFAVP